MPRYLVRVGKATAQDVVEVDVLRVMTDPDDGSEVQVHKQLRLTQPALLQAFATIEAQLKAALNLD